MERRQCRANDNFPQEETTAMVWPRVKEGRGGYHQEDVKHASARKEKKGEAQEKMVGQYQGGHERVQDDGRHGTKSKCVAREDKGRPIATWRRPLGEKVRRTILGLFLC